MKGLLRWEETRKPTHAGLAGSVWLFTYTRADSKQDPGKPWVLSTVLPGCNGRQWRAADEMELRTVAAGVLADWLKQIGVPS
jgi:hypothetical protein